MAKIVAAVVTIIVFAGLVVVLRGVAEKPWLMSLAGAAGGTVLTWLAYGFARVTGMPQI